MLKATCASISKFGCNDAYVTCGDFASVRALAGMNDGGEEIFADSFSSIDVTVSRAVTGTFKFRRKIGRRRWKRGLRESKESISLAMFRTA